MAGRDCLRFYCAQCRRENNILHRIEAGGDDGGGAVGAIEGEAQAPCAAAGESQRLTKLFREMIEAGGNVYYLAKFAGIFGLGVQDIGAQQTGMSVEEFRAKLQAAAV